MRKRLFEILEISAKDDKVSHAYDIFMIAVITMSLVPLGVKGSAPFFI